MSLLSSIFENKNVDVLGLNRAVGKAVGGKKGSSTTPLTDQYGAAAMQGFSQQFPQFLQSYNQQTAQAKGGRTFEQWLSDGWKENPNDQGNIAAQKALSTFQSTGQWPGAAAPTSTSAAAGPSQPAEEGLYNIVEPSLINDINQDQQRQNLASTLGGQLQQQYGTAENTLQSALGPTFNSDQYFKDHPDVAAAYAQSDHSKTPQAFALAAYQASGENNPAYFSTLLQRDDQNADNTSGAIVANDQASAASQLAALAQYTASAKANLSGDLAAKAAALSDQIASLQNNQSTLTQAQKDALSQQITSQLGDLNDSIAAQKDALNQKVATLQGATDTQSQQELASVQQQLATLNAAEAPVASARSQAAQTQASSINLGLQSTEDQLTANQALQGYVGGSTTDEAALARAAIIARQNAASAVGNANVTNAQDYQGIANTGANETNSIGQAIAGQHFGITASGAEGANTLANALATGTQGLKDTGAAGLASITNAGAVGQKGIADQGANTTYANNLYGADQTQAIGNNDASGQQSIAATLAGQTATAKNAGAAAKSSYYDANYNRSLQAALTAPTLTNNLVGNLTNLDNYGRSGLNRSLQTLNWWNSAATPSTPNALAVQPSTSGNSLSSLGAGLVGLAGTVGNANNWWQTSTNNSGVGQPTTYAQFLQNNPTSSAAQGQTYAPASFTPIDTNWTFANDPVPQN